MPNSVNQTSGGLFSLVDMPVMKSLPPEPSESFDSAMKKAKPQPQPSDQQQSSQKTAQTNSKQDTKKTSKSSKGKPANKKTDRVDKQEDQDEQDADQANAVAAADAVGKDSTDDGNQKGGKKKDAKEPVAAGKASKADPLLQALATPTQTISARATSHVEKDDEAAESATANASRLKTPAQKKTTATPAKPPAETKKAQAADQTEDAEQLQDADNAVNEADDGDAWQQVSGKQAKTKTSGLGADDDANQSAYGAGQALKAPTAQTDQLSAQQQQAADDAAMAAAATSAMPTAANNTPVPSDTGDSGTSAVSSIDHLTALATDLTSTSAVQGKTVATTTAAQTAKADAASVAAQAFTPPEVQFADSNHAKIVGGIQGQLLPNGGTMQIRLDPPELGALQVSIHMQNGVVNATFETSNDNATNVLSHSLSQLKHALETQGVTVDKLHVQQSPRDQQTSSDDQQKNQSPSEQSQQKQEQQRRELLQRMWKRLANGSDPLDMVA